MHTAAEKLADGPRPTPWPGARPALALLLVINLFNMIDRYILAAVEPRVREEFFPAAQAPGATPELQAYAKGMMGLLVPAFLVSYMTLSPLFGWLGDRTARWKLVGIGVILWSLASGASGLAADSWVMSAYWLMFLTRCFVGVGEAAYGPVAPSMISDMYPERDRGRALAWFYMAIPVGGALGYAIGDLAAGWLGWRWAFYLVVPPGVLLGVVCFFMPEPPRGQTPASAGRHLRLRDYRVLLRTPSYVLNTAGMTAMTFALGGIAYWMPDYLEGRERAGEYVRLGPIGGKTLFGAITALAGLVATLAGGIAGDRLKRRFGGAYFLVSGSGMLVGLPLFLAFLVTPFPWAWLLVVPAIFCLFFNTGPANTVLANVTHPAIRSGAFAINIFIIHALGDVISPTIIGWVGGYYGMNVGFLVVSAAILASGLLWLTGVRFEERDTRIAPHRLGET
jgi:MFS family permease